MDKATETAEPKTAVQWSYSAYKRFDNCPRQYHQLTVLKNYQQQDTEALRSGRLVHKIAEDYVRDGTPVPDTHKYLREWLDGLREQPGGKLTEYEMAVRRDFTPCDFDAPDRWWRGIADLVVIGGEDRERALLVDYKTGRNIRYADENQLHVLAAALFTHFPQLKYVYGALFFVNLGEAVTRSFTRPVANELWRSWEVRLKAIEAAHESGVWNPKPSPLCRFCPVATCDHHKG